MQKHHIIFQSLKRKMMFSIILFIILPFFFSSYYILNKTQRVLQDKVINQMQADVARLNQDFIETTNNIRTFAGLISVDQFINAYLLYPDTQTEYDLYVISNGIKERISSLGQAFPSLSTYITIIDKSGHIFATYGRLSRDSLLDSFENSSWWNHIDSIGGVWNAPHQNYYFAMPSDQKFISYAKKIRSLSDGSFCGTLLISCYVNDFANKLSDKMPDNQGLIILNADNGVILEHLPFEFSGDYMSALLAEINKSHRDNFVFSIGKERFIVVVPQQSILDWTTIGITPYKVALADILHLEQFNNFYFITFAFLLLLSVWILSNQISKPLTFLTNQMKYVKNGKLDIERYPISSKDEIGQLTQSFYDMLEDIKGYICNISKMETEKNRSNIRAMQAQIHPHFLFNTLNTIKWKAYMLGYTQFGNMITDLAKLYEISTETDSEYITIEAEMNFIEPYVRLMRIRFNNDVRLIIDIPEELRICIILKFILQPIIENSFLHGFCENTGQDNYILIHAEASGENLVLVIEDNGVGIPEEYVTKIINELDCTVTLPNHIALKNIHQRIRLNYGQDFGLDILSRLNEYTKITVRIPYLTKEPREEHHV